MYIVDDKNFNFYDRIFNVLDGRGIDCLPVSKVEMDEKSKPADTFIANVDQSFDCKKNPDFLTLASSFGAFTRRVSQTEDFMPAVEGALKSNKLSVIELVTDKNQLSTRLHLDDIN